MQGVCTTEDAASCSIVTFFCSTVAVYTEFVHKTSVIVVECEGAMHESSCALCVNAGYGVCLSTGECALGVRDGGNRICVNQ